MTFYWYETANIPRLEFKWLRNYPGSKFYVAFDGELEPKELDQTNAVELGRMTLNEFESKYGTFMRK